MPCKLTKRIKNVAVEAELHAQCQLLNFFDFSDDYKKGFKKCLDLLEEINKSKNVKNKCNCKLINLNTMITFKINFLDSNNNVLFDKVDLFYDIYDVNKYANQILATTSINDLVTFEIFEL
jgi:hypothetical protein